jgi:hypothetical protein
VVGHRLPIIVLTGPADELKAQLANLILKSSALHPSALSSSALSYAVVSESAISASIAKSNQSAKSLETFSVDGCLCCIGAVTLMAQLTRLLRAQRRENQYQGILVVAGAHTKCAVLIDQLRQPLLAELVYVNTVVHVCLKILQVDADEISASDIVYCSQEQQDELRLTPALWLADLPGGEDRVFTSHIDQAHDLVLPKSATINKVIWPAEKTFDRQKLQNFFDKAVKDGLCFDAVFRTQRAWYRWRVLNNTQHLAPILETAYRRQSYLHWYPTEGSQARFNALKSAIALLD